MMCLQNAVGAPALDQCKRAATGELPPLAANRQQTRGPEATGLPLPRATKAPHGLSCSTVQGTRHRVGICARGRESFRSRLEGEREETGRATRAQVARHSLGRKGLRIA